MSQADCRLLGILFSICFFASGEVVIKMPLSVKLKHMTAAFLRLNSNKQLLVLMQSQDVRSCT